jgi:hypothetical protein
VIIVGNFGVTSLTTQPFFQEAGTWYDVVTETSLEVSDTAMNVSLAPGEFKVYFNNQPSLSTNEVSALNYTVYPNPTANYFSISNEVDAVQVYDMNGRLIKDYKGSFNANHRFGVENLSPGLYFITYRNQQNFETKKLMIN